VTQAAGGLAFCVTGATHLLTVIWHRSVTQVTQRRKIAGLSTAAAEGDKSDFFAMRATRRALNETPPRSWWRKVGLRRPAFIPFLLIVDAANAPGRAHREKSNRPQLWVDSYDTNRI
jgi:hypothetical protein